MTRSGNPIVLDFEGVGVITSGFADEFFGRLFVAMGPRALMKRIRLINVDPPIKPLVTSAVRDSFRVQ